MTTCIVITCGGLSVASIDDLLLRAPTRRIGERYLAAELRTAAAQDRVRR